MFVIKKLEFLQIIKFAVFILFVHTKKKMNKMGSNDKDANKLFYAKLILIKNFNYDLAVWGILQHNYTVY